ncbi:MAG: hypothetical protein JXL84_15990 [Deltaproteobacteria bacterium]|nr:hypothetical protein [Deltaproteobacteria bacterium]
MNLKAKVHVENQKKRAEAKLVARRAFLKEKGFNDDAIRKDVTVRKLKADLRKADFRLASIAAQERLNQARAQAKAEKLAAGKAPKKAVKEVIQEKGGKKEKPEKKAKSGGKKEKPDKNTE